MKRSMVNTGRIFLLLSLAITYVTAAAAMLLKAATYGELRQSVVKHAPDLDQFRVRGPFDVNAMAAAAAIEGHFVDVRKWA